MIANRQDDLIVLIIGSDLGAQRLQICNLLRLTILQGFSCAILCAQVLQKKVNNVFFINCINLKVADFVDLEQQLHLVPTANGTCFVFENIEKMPLIIANKLLKKLEEPPPSLSFIFTTSNEDLVLPTIRSRCHHKIYQESLVTQEKTEVMNDFSFCEDELAFLNLFLGELQIKEASRLDQLLKKINPDEDMSKRYLELLLQLTTKQQGETPSQAVCEKITILSKAFASLPQSGCSNFWRHLFLLLVN